MILKLKDSYGVWQSMLPHIPKAQRYTLGSKIDGIFLDALEYSFLASYSAHKDKLLLLDRCIARVDLLKLLVQLALETKALDAKKYENLGGHLIDAGRMLGGWRRHLVQKNPALGQEGRGEK